jgi:glycerol-3-phosphate dehydrogenase
MRISIETVDRGTEIAARVAALIGPELGWTDTDITNEVERWHSRVDAELDANATPDDETAQSVRRTAIDGRGLVGA